MTTMDQTTILVATLAVLAAGGLFYAIVYPYISGQAKAEKRQSALTSRSRVIKTADRSVDVANRRRQITESLKELEQKSTTKRKTSIEDRLLQAGLTWTKSQFLMISAASGLILGLLVFFMSQNLLYAVPCMAIGALGLPNWFVNFMRKRRINKFITEFPNAVDVIIRGIKAGLPLGDCLRVIASEAAEPVRSEFRQIIETQSIGMPLGEAIERLVTRVPVAEANFFSIVINIQQKSGGNLSEALGNLSRVLRDRKKMKHKIKAMSSEAKASAYIIGSLPFAVTALVYITAPTYIELLWTTSTGRMVMGVSGLWMLIGIMSMKKMINFDI
jgi:tight adherence protein B